MKATIEFNLDEEDDKFAHARAIKALDVLMVIWDFDSYLREQCKYQGNDIACTYREKFREIMGDHEVNLDNLIK